MIFVRETYKIAPRSYPLISMNKRIRQARKRANLTQQALADICGVSRVAVTQWESSDPKQNTKPDYDKLQKIAEATGESLEWLVTGKSVQIAHGELTEINVIAEDVPLISWVQAGEWMEAEDPYPPGNGERLLPRIKGGPMTFALRVSGDSMIAPPGASKTFLPGEIIYVDPDQKTPNNGDFVVAKVNGRPEVTFKQFKIEDGRPYLFPLNPDFKPIFDEFRILGRVIQKLQDL